MALAARQEPEGLVHCWPSSSCVNLVAAATNIAAHGDASDKKLSEALPTDLHRHSRRPEALLCMQCPLRLSLLASASARPPSDAEVEERNRRRRHGEEAQSCGPLLP